MKNLQKYAFVNTGKHLDLEAINDASKKPREYKI
jgi:hypothetical protein